MNKLTSVIDYMANDADISLIIGAQGSGRTKFLTDFTKCVATGEKFYGYEHPCFDRVLYIPQEDAPAVKKYFKANENNKNIYIRVAQDSIDISDKQVQEKLAYEIESFDITILILDLPVIKDMLDFEVINEVFDFLKRLAKDGTTTVMSMHETKIATLNARNAVPGGNHIAVVPKIILRTVPGSEPEIIKLSGRAVPQ